MRPDDALKEIEKVASLEKRWRHHQQRQQQDVHQHPSPPDLGADEADDQEADQIASTIERHGGTMEPRVWHQLNALRCSSGTSVAPPNAM